jgi:hypothetical protein
MEKKLGMRRPAAGAVASAKKNYPNAKFPWYGKREDLQSFVKEPRNNKGYSRTIISRHYVRELRTGRYHSISRIIRTNCPVSKF